MFGFMAAEAEKEISGLDLARQPATPALARYLGDLSAMIGFQAYLWRMIVRVDYGHLGAEEYTDARCRRL